MRCQFADEASADTVESGKQAAPDVMIAPKIFAGVGVNDGKVGFAAGRGFRVGGDGIRGNAPIIVNGAGLPIGEENIAGVIRVGRAGRRGSVPNRSGFYPIF